jgi:outer membrane lipoprotein SlyB
MKKGMLVACIVVMFSGCTGMITGHVYTAEEIKQIREIAKDVYQDAKYVKEDMGK